ncbi:MAG: acyl-CoA dehydrogenase family protein [Myxococcota bacterium]|nr:acyl-CoA dehydrogenase family protein [Myxococcota bacterium]
MEMVLTEDQELIAKTANDFVKEKSPISRMRKLRDQADPMGYSRALWKEMAELGWVGIALPESVGGAGMGMSELVVVVEALGRSLAPEPFISCVGLASAAVLELGTEAQQELWLTPVASGEQTIAFAHLEPETRYEPHAIQSEARREGDGFVLSGRKIQVLDGFGAEAFVVVARTDGASGEAEGISLFWVPADAEGVSVERQTLLDSRNAAIVQFENVQVPQASVLGEPGQCGEALERIIERGTVVLCAEMLGGMSEAFRLTVDYLKEREQFGTRIGTFQGLKHRAARVFMEIELARSCVMAAARAIDESSEDASKLVSLAKARCSDAYILAANEGVQMFGGVGMTDEYDIGLFMKRARMSELTLGDANHHRKRWSALSNY